MRPEPDRSADTRAIAIGEALVVFYRAAERSMRGLPVYNPSLGYAAVGFRAHDGRALGVLATPWFMNLVSAPIDHLADGRPGEIVTRSLPAGVFDFTVSALDGIGSIESCSLFSPMFEFADHAAAVATAEAVMAAVLDPAAVSDGEAAPPGAAWADLAVDRRRFLRGALSGAGR